VAVEDDLLRLVEQQLCVHYGSDPLRATVSFVGVDEIDVLCFPGEGIEYLATVGMSRFPMGDPTSAIVDQAAPRGELILALAPGQRDAWRHLAVLAASPVVEGAVLDDGGRADLTEPWLPGSRCVGVLMRRSPVEPVPIPGGGHVEFLDLLPATSAELAWARVHGSTALQQRWATAGTDLADLRRSSVDLRSVW
jgi:hypothetical protein